MLRLATVAGVCLLALVALLIVTDSTLAQQQLTVVRPGSTPIPPRAGPGPLVGVGLPVFAGVLGILMFVLGYRRKQ